MKKGIAVILVIFSLFICTELNAASISISGSVKQPLNLSIQDICRFKTVRIQLNEILKDRSYRGAWYYNGVPLRTLLETAYIEKEETPYKKVIDLAILVRNKDGKEVALSWGEVFYRNSYDIIIATSASPLKPHHDCKSCHSPEESDPYMKQFDRKIGRQIH
jgi:hypothetical protein